MTMNNPRKHAERAAERARHLMGQDHPSADNAERGLLSCVLQSPVCMAVAQEVIATPEAFGRPAHTVIWEAAVKLGGGGADIHPSALEAVIGGRGMLAEVGGLGALLSLYEIMDRPTAETARSLAGQVIAMHAKRRLVVLGLQAVVDGYESEAEAADLLDGIQTAAMQISQSLDGGGGTTGSATLGEMMYAEDEDTGGPPIPTGLYDLDRMVEIRSGDLIVIGARPSMGKTALLTGMAVGMSEGSNAVDIHSLEMGRFQLRDRIVSAKSRVSTKRWPHLMDGSMEAYNLSDARESLAKLPITIHDAPGLTLARARAMTRQAVTQRNAKAVYIDYLQLMTTDKSDSRQEAIAALSRGLKIMAREFGVAVILLSQLNRQAENREGNRPKMSDLRESGAIEQDADIVMLLHRPDYYASQKDRSHVPDNVAEVIVAKQRNGPTGVVRLHFDAECAGMMNSARSEDDQRQGDMAY